MKQHYFTFSKCYKQLLNLFIFSFCLIPSLFSQTYVNGNLSTGSTANNGDVAPTSTTWSEVQNNAGVTTISNTVSGVVSSLAANRLAGACPAAIDGVISLGSGHGCGGLRHAGAHHAIDGRVGCGDSDDHHHAAGERASDDPASDPVMTDTLHDHLL